MPQEPVVVRPRAETDVRATAVQLRRVHERDGYPLLWPDDPQKWLSPPGTVTAWVAVETDGLVLGHLCVVTGVDDPAVTDLARSTGRTESELAGVSRLFVAPAARGRGLRLGERLLEEARAWARDHDRLLMLDVVEDGGSAVALYERLGWQQADRRVADWATPDGRYLPMRIYLAPPYPRT
ncbi:GNAT family N-acetyltransferase [Kineosporia sp. NBRC 101731]|uniref:GNAT family N-acetyltransferase n=1 Tax=Kineosporia sp. NBRC 101731 TaxID=3032199 RepID=UPI0024A104E6|nr:GNAT family N-acetyltransferase [Kineosporia sp. NBRC 101731]GLY27955.1 GNAT family N-acetyltransferase [Kineosporia sp. NBRC 101731]